MPEYSYPFDAGTGSILTEDDWSDMAKNWQDDGVISDTTNSTLLPLRVDNAGATPNVVTVDPGLAIVQGFMYRNTEQIELSFSSNGTADPRIDRVVLRLNRNTNLIQAVVIEGVPATTPVPPALNTTYPVHEFSLATYSVNAGASVASSVVHANTLASRRIRVSEETTGFPVGIIVYRPSTSKFYTVDDTGTMSEMGSGGGIEFIDEFSIPETYEDDRIIMNKTRRRFQAYANWGGYTGWSDIAGMGRTTYKQFTSGPVSGAGTTVDEYLFYTLPSPGNYIVSGTVFYQSNTAAATCTLSLQGPTTFGGSPRGLFRHHGGSNTTIVQTTSAAFSSGCTIGTPAATTPYAVTFEFSVNASATDATIAVRTNNHSGSSAWTLLTASWLRVERI
jgi:hypothetical protein